MVQQKAQIAVGRELTVVACIGLGVELAIARHGGGERAGGGAVCHNCWVDCRCSWHAAIGGHLGVTCIGNISQQNPQNAIKGLIWNTINFAC